MPKLTDTQSLLLAHAAQADGGSLYPLPASLAEGTRAAKAITAPVKRGLAEERETSAPAQVLWTVGELRHGAYITTAGVTAIGVADEEDDSGRAEAPSPAPQPRSSKIAGVLVLLARSEGATLPELIDATGWLPHTTRAALTALRKKGHMPKRSKRDDVTCYRLVEAR